MKTFTVKKTLLTLSLLNALALQGQAQAGEGDTFTPYYSHSITYDSNMLRIDDDDDVLVNGVRGRSDTLRKNLLGVNGDWQVSRQQFVVHAAVSDNKFQRFNTLDYQGRYLKTQWNYKIGNRISGNVGQVYNRALASFNDIRGIGGNLRDQQNQFFNMNWQFHPRWQTGISFSWNELQYDAPIQKVGDFESYVMGINLDYTTPKGSKLGFLLSQEDGRYPNRSAAEILTLDNAYIEDKATVSMDWRYSVKTLLRFQGGYVERGYDNVPQRDYTAFDKRLSLVYQPTVKTEVQLAFYDETNPRDDLQASVTENQGQSLQLSWLPTSKITVEAIYKNETREDLNDPGFSIAPSFQRVENNDQFSFSVNYAPRDNVDLTAGYRKSERATTEYLGDFDAEIFSFTATIRM